MSRKAVLMTTLIVFTSSTMSA